ncbi:DUF4287 domain-containing protein [Alteromonas ponticola]|uniref:DUF4287 domain-containing protein n=1 Tax=Alteromonas aquimaris TaxID=2998417 RepID=A0ABT3P2C0_9ALTE|nr:DUF5655 domain-containing protein [Alteromonas aquimaris]MCW8106907.1 DUF4287 domain-containing protein [Alteromonas aquimaris]
MEENLKPKTGKTLEQWKTVLGQTKLTKHSEIVAWLKSEHQLTHGFANFISLKFRQADAASFDESELIASQYETKPGLKPIYDALVEYCRSLGPDVEIAPKKSTVSIRRKRQFALIKPATKTRMDIGLKFNDKKPLGRLLPSGPFGTMCTHRIELTEVSDIDDEIKKLVREAYAEAG